MQRQRFVFLNHALVAMEQAHISADDSGFLLGDGVFETCGAFAGVPFLLDEHMQRLRASLQFVGITVPEELDALPQIIPAVLQANDLLASAARLRITVSRGAGQEPTFVVTAAAWQPPLGIDSGVELDFTTYPVIASPWCQVKSTSRQMSVLAARARGVRIYDSLQYNTQGALTEGTYSNLFCADSRGLMTPRVEDGCLAGVTRGAVLKIAQRLGVAVREESIRPDDLAAMQEVFLTSSMSGLVPVKGIQLPATIPAAWQTTIHAGTNLQWVAPGPLTLKMRGAYRAWQEDATCQQR